MTTTTIEIDITKLPNTEEQEIIKSIMCQALTPQLTQRERMI